MGGRREGWDGEVRGSGNKRGCSLWEMGGGAGANNNRCVDGTSRVRATGIRGVRKKKIHVHINQSTADCGA